MDERKKADALYFETVGLRKKGRTAEAKEKIDVALKLTASVSDDSDRKQKYVAEKATFASATTARSAQEAVDALAEDRLDDALAAVENALDRESTPELEELEELEAKILAARDGKTAKSEELLRRGVAYLVGTNEEKIDVDAGMNALEEASALGNLTARARLAEILYLGFDGVVPDAKKAFELAQEPARADAAEALCVLGEYYYWESGATRNVARGRDYLRRAFEGYKKLAEEGDAWAQNDLACFYFGRLAKATGIEPNDKITAAWFKKSAERGEAMAQATNLASMKLSNGDAEITESDAFLWAKKAADQGLKEGLAALSQCYQNGVGVEQNLTRAFELTQKAAELGYLSGC